jgi:hypothetical protein
MTVLNVKTASMQVSPALCIKVLKIHAAVSLSPPKPTFSLPLPACYDVYIPPPEKYRSVTLD